MNSIHYFKHCDIIKLGFVFLEPSNEDLFLEAINTEYIGRINKAIAEKLTDKEINFLSEYSRSEIYEYINYHYPDCISCIQTIKARLEDELRQSRKDILSGEGPTFIFRDFSPSEIE